MAKQKKVGHYEAARVVGILVKRFDKLVDAGNDSLWCRGLCVVAEEGGNHHVEVRVASTVVRALEFFYPELEIDGVQIRVKAAPLARAL